MGLGNLYGLDKKLNFIDTAERIASRGAKLAEDTYNNLTSGEEFINNLPGFAANAALLAPLGPVGLGLSFLGSKYTTEKLGTPKYGTKAGEFLGENTPYGLGRDAFDIGASPLTIATAGGGGALSAALRGTQFAKAAPLVSPVLAKGGFGKRLAAETATGLGAVGGTKLVSNILPESTPSEVSTPLSLLGGIVGAGVGARASGKALGGITKPQEKAEMVFQKGRLPGDEEKRFIPSSIDPDNVMDSAAVRLSTKYPEDLAKQRLWAHATKDYSFDLPDPEFAVGQATAISQGAGLYMAANPEKVTWAGNRMFISVLDENAKVMNMGGKADWDVWGKILKELGISEEDFVITTSKPYGGKNVRTWSGLKGDKLNNFEVRDALVEALNKKDFNTLTSGMSRKWKDQIQNADADSVAKTAINEKLADNNIDAFFYKSSHEDEVLVVLNGDKARVLGEADLSRLTASELVGKSYKEIAGQAIAKGNKKPEIRVSFEVPEGYNKIGAIYADDRLLDWITPSPNGGVYFGGKYYGSVKGAVDSARDEWGISSNDGFPLKPAGKQKTAKERAIEFISGSSGESGSISPTVAAQIAFPALAGGATYAATGDEEKALMAAGVTGAGAYAGGKALQLKNRPKRVYGPGEVDALKKDLDDIRTEQSQISMKQVPVTEDEWLNYLELEKQAEEVLSNLPKVKETPQGLFSTINNTLRALGAGLDSSAIGIQNLLGYGSISGKKQFEVLISGYRSLWNAGSKESRLIQWDKEAIAKSHPVQAQWTSGSNPLVHLEGDRIPGTESATSWVNNIPGFKQTNRMFNTMIDLQARALADTLFDMAETGGAMLTSGKVSGGGWKNLEAIKNTANRTVGYSNTKLPVAIREAFFAPTFIKANLELIWKGMQDGTIEGQVARRQLAKLAVIGSSLVIGINTAKGETTDLDPRSNNFMRIKNVGGVDISPFGYMDTLVRGMVLAATDPIINPIIQAIHGEKITPNAPSLNDMTYLIQSKASPLLGLGIDLYRNRTFSGEDPRSIAEIAKRGLPFSVRDIGEEPVTGSVANAFGFKASPLTEQENLSAKLRNAGINEDDPDYEIKRKEYLFQNPSARPQYSGDIKRSREVTEDISAKRKQNEEALRSGSINVAQFRENRGDLIKAQRDKLSMLDLGDGKKKGKQGEWINSFIKLYSTPGITNPINDKLDPDKFDSAVATWIDKNGEEAYDFVQRYLEAGHGPIEKQYIQDMRKLNDLGYFDMPHYRGLTSDLADSELNSIRDSVSAMRSADPRLKNASFSRVAQYILRDKYPREVILDVVRMGLKQHQDPVFTRFKAQHQDLLQWFNPNATYESLQTAKSRAA